MSKVTLVPYKSNSNAVSNDSIHTIKHMNNSHHELKKWLKRKCENSDNVFKDPGYSNFYKGMFGITDNDFFYLPNNQDIDLNRDVNVGYVSVSVNNSTDNGVNNGANISTNNSNSEFYSETYDKLGQFVDVNSENEQIAILPGSNHSNSNYLFKLITIECEEYEPYIVPDKYDNRNLLKMRIDKVQFYNFMKMYSD